MLQPSEGFSDRVRVAWGNPEAVANIGIDETFKHEDHFGLDHDDQVNTATLIGIMAGQTAEKSPEEFIQAFTAYLNEHED
jgi:hypothetical protein